MDLIAADRRTDVLLHISDHQIVSGIVIDVGPLLGVVHAIGQVSHQHDLHSVARKLPKPKGPSKDAHVGMHADHDDLFDLPALQDRPNLISFVADVVFARIDDDRRVLRFPRQIRIAPERLEFVGP